MLMPIAPIIRLLDAVQIYVSEKQEAIREIQGLTATVTMIAWPELSPVQLQNAFSIHNVMTETFVQMTSAMIQEYARTPTIMRLVHLIAILVRMMFAAAERVLLLITSLNAVLAINAIQARVRRTVTFKMMLTETLTHHVFLKQKSN
jgi:hypothetical protein